MSQNLSDVSRISPVNIPNSDWFLEALVRIANDYDKDSGITLSIGGSVISGILISGRKYFEQLATENHTEAFVSLGDIYKPENIDVDKPMPIDYIHLKDAKIINGTTVIPSSGGRLWRGKLASVDGFSLGTLSINKE